MLRKIFLVVFLFFSFIFTPRAFAAAEFATSYDVTYDIDLNGITQVTEKISLRNLTEQYYANQFKLIIGATQVSDIKASDGGGALEVTSEQPDTSTNINVKFNQQVVGLNKVLAWTLQFKSKDFAQKTGKVWEVRAPKISASSNLENYHLTILVPLQFGELNTITPIPKSQTIQGNKLWLTFEKGQLLQSGVSANFGITQLFDFELIYHLDNTNLVPILTNIALPPDTAYQDVIYRRIEPKPLNVTVDDDGNYLAWYRLNRADRLDIKVNGSAKLYTQSKVKNPVLDLNLRNKYTQAQKFWEKDHPQVQQKLAEILANSKDTTEKIKLIYRYVVDSLKYDSSKLDRIASGGVDRLGAVTALNNPERAVCMEFTDLFMALARVADIPTRELNGFAYTANPTLRPLSLSKDILHAWPEYWDDKKGWVMVDPTWENTSGGVDYFNKFDLNHFVFAIKGSSSQMPVPAGSYKYIGQDSQDVKVTLSENDFLGAPNLDVKIENSNPILAGFPGKIKVSIVNQGNAVYPTNSFSVTADKLAILEGRQQNLGPIPAFGQATFDLNIRTLALFDSYNDRILVSVGSQKFSKDVTVKPFLIFQTYPMVAIGVVSLVGLIYLVVLGGHIYKARLAQKIK